MRNLFRAAMVRYTYDLFIIGAALLTLMFGVFFGVTADPFDARMELMIEPHFMMVGILLCAAAVVLSTGREFSDNTIRNKLIAGYRKTQIIGAEMLSACVITVIFYLLFFAPLMILQHERLALLPFYGCCKMFGLWLIAYLIFTLITVGVTFFLSHRTYAIIAATALIWGVFIGGYTLNNLIYFSKDEYYIDTAYFVDEDGTEHFEETKEKNPDYLPEKKRKMLRAVEMLTPEAALRVGTDYIFYTVPQVPEDDKQEFAANRTRDEHAMESLYPIQIVTLLLTAGCGVLLFRRRNVK